MKKLVAALLVGTMCFGLVGCGQTADTSADAPAETTTEGAADAATDVADEAAADDGEVFIGLAMHNQTETWAVQFADTFKEEAEAAGIPVITHTTHYDAASAFISIDETEMGETLGSAAGQWMVDTFGEDEDVEYAVLTRSTLPQTINRSNGIQTGIAEYMPNAKCVTTVDAWLPDMGMEAAETILQGHPNVKAILGINDSGALGAYEACVAADVGDEFFIGGVDGTETAIKNINDGTIYRATVDIGPLPTGKMAVDYAIKLVQGKEVPAETMVEVKAITKDNAEEYLKLFE